MLFREDQDGLIVVMQPTHAWVSGQLARAWGNVEFGSVEPSEEVCLGATLHDLGWESWEQRPTLHPRTGRPRRFFELPTDEHVGIWRGASRRALTYGRYPALLVSLHVSGLYQRHDYTEDTPAEAQAARDFLAQESTFQEELLASLRAEPRYARTTIPDAVRRNQRLVAVWDRLSLALCAGLKAPLSVPDVPAATGAAELTLSPTASGAEVTPWPFRTSQLSLIAEGRRLPNTLTNQDELRTALATAPWTSFAVELSPAAALL
jgi:hypothetical protein